MNSACKRRDSAAAYLSISAAALAPTDPATDRTTAAAPLSWPAVPPVRAASRAETAVNVTPTE